MDITQSTHYHLPIVLRHIRLAHSLKTALTIGISYVLAIFINIPFAQWILITAIVVMGTQTTVGGFIKKSYGRLFGTLIGAILGISTLALIPQNTILIGIVLIISTLLFTYFSFGKEDYSYATSLGVITLILIVMIEPATIQHGLLRVLDILIGITVSGLTTFFIFPTFARDVYIKNLKPLLIQYATLFDESIIQEKNRKLHESTQKIDEKITVLIYEQRKLLNESKTDWPRKPGFLNQCRDILKAILRMHRHLNLLEYYYHADLVTHEFLKNQNGFIHYCNEIRQLLNDLIKATNFTKKKSVMVFSLPDIKPLQDELTTALATHENVNINLIHAFYLSAERLNFHIEHLITLLQSLAR